MGSGQFAFWTWIGDLEEMRPSQWMTHRYKFFGTCTTGYLMNLAQAMDYSFLTQTQLNAHLVPIKKVMIQSKGFAMFCMLWKWDKVKIRLSAGLVAFELSE